MTTSTEVQAQPAKLTRGQRITRALIALLFGIRSTRSASATSAISAS
jgi:hypothetical protein